MVTNWYSISEIYVSFFFCGNFSLERNFICWSFVEFFFFYENEGLAPLVGTFLRFCAHQYLFFSWGNYPYLLCTLYHANTLTHNRIFEHKGIDALLSRLISSCELIDIWMKENILLDGSLSSCFICQDIRLEFKKKNLKLCMTHSLKNG